MMSTHQIIYTSCMRGIDGIKDGQQVYSHDAGFQDADRDQIKVLFSYHHPRLEDNVSMTEELARRMPQSFVYRRFDSGLCALALNTYLGRDYMGSTGRFGNHLSHVVTFDPEETACYPAEYYGSGMLRSSMRFEEVNDPERPPYLPAPQLYPGSAVDIYAVQNFLNGDDRMRVYKTMLCAMLSFEEARKRVVICDDPQNIILWIAALQYALPLKNALSINFSTYDFDPALSSSQVCGVVPGGTQYGPESHRQHFVFDLFQERMPELELDPDFYDFIDAAMSFSYESLQDFHEFLSGGFRYDRADQKLYRGYTLYSFLADGMDTISRVQLAQALQFADEFARPEMTAQIVHHLLFKNRLFSGGDRNRFMEAVRYVMRHAQALDENSVLCLKDILVDRVMTEFRDVGIREDEFQDLYREINQLCAQQDFCLAAELLHQRNGQKLFSVLGQDIENWKLAFTVQVLSDYVKERAIPVDALYPSERLGQLYCGIVTSVYARSRDTGAYMVERILREFSGMYAYFTKMAVHMEGLLLELPGGGQWVEPMWRYFDSQVLGRLSANLSGVIGILKSFGRYDRVFGLFVQVLNGTEDVRQCDHCFVQHYNSHVLGNEQYARTYQIPVLEAYYRKLGTFPASAALESKRSLLGFLAGNGIIAPFGDELVGDLIRPILLERLSAADSKSVETLIGYHCGLLGRRLQGKLLLLKIGKTVDQAGTPEQLRAGVVKLAELMNHQRMDLATITEAGTERFFEWVLPEVCCLYSRTDDLLGFRDMFEMPPAAEELFYEICAQHYLKHSKNGKDTMLLREFVGAVLRNSCPESRFVVGDVLSKLGKRQMEHLNGAVKSRYQEDAQAMENWQEILAASDPGNPVFKMVRGIVERIPFLRRSNDANR